MAHCSEQSFQHFYSFEREQSMDNTGKLNFKWESSSSSSARWSSSMLNCMDRTVILIKRSLNISLIEKNAHCIISSFNKKRYFLFLSLSTSFTHYISLDLACSFFLFHSLCMSFALFFSLSLTLSLPLSRPHSLSLPLSFFLSLSFSFTPSIELVSFRAQPFFSTHGL